MRRAGKESSARVEHAVGRAMNYELTVADLARKSERRAWFVAGSAVVLALMLGGGMAAMLPLKEKVPYVVMADAYSGNARVASLRGGLDGLVSTQWDALHRSNVAHYVIARESYDLALLNLRDWTVVYTMSAPEVATSYTTLNSSQNPESPFNLYGKHKAIRVHINSIQMIGGSPTQRPKGATVRFQRSLYDKSNGYTDFLDNRIATLEFKYDATLKMDEKHRIENPLGFRVTAYRVDSDFSSTPPPAVPRPQADPAPPQAVATSGATVAMPQDASVDGLPAAMQAPLPTAPAAPVPATAPPATTAPTGGAQ